MKKLSVLLFLVILSMSGRAAILNVTVTNPLDMDRSHEIVSVELQTIQQKLNLGNGSSFIIVNANGAQIPYQILANKTTVIFPASVKAKGKAEYIIEAGVPDKFSSKTFGRFVPERKDDFAWESDRIAFRMYGPALASENPSNGVDVWVKKTSSLIVNKFYYNDLKKGLHYHVDRGEGLDCYKVGHALGAGGIAPYTDTTLWVGNHFNKWRVIENGPLRTTFKLIYDSVRVGKNWIKETLTISLDAGSNLNKGVVRYEGVIPADMKLAAGIFLHDGQGVTKTDDKAGYIGYGEVATSDDGVPAGRDYVGVILGNKLLSSKRQGDHLLAFAAYNKVAPLTYYFGAGWSQWGFADDQAWFDYLRDFSLKIKQPLKVKVN